jgi:poly-gamma-glutamate synthesis protein (capsule biosynthesis protein)
VASKRWLALVAGGVAAGVLLTATGTSRNDVATEPSTTTTTSSTTSTTVLATTTTTLPPPDPFLGNGEAVTIAFAGDTSFDGQMGARLDADPATAIGPFTDVLAAADLAVGNLETAIGTTGTPEDKEFTFLAPPVAVDAMRAGGFDAVSMANNHGRDFGPDALAESLAVRAAQPDGLLIGIGADDTDAFKPFRATVRGQRIAVIAATQVIDTELVASWTAGPGQPGLASAKDVDRLATAVREARATSDTVVVFLHWGVELETCPNRSQQSLAQALADAGADIVIGGHAHRLQGAGFLGRAFVGYGLGNFDFYANGAEAERTGVVRVTITGRRVDAYDFVPGRIRGALATPLDGPAADDAVAAWNALRDCTGLTAAPT